MQRRQFRQSDGEDHIEFKDKSKKAKTNRDLDVEGSMHTRGSIPMSEHKKRLSKQFGRPSIQIELFLAIHRKRDSSGFVDRRLTSKHDNMRHYHRHRHLANQKIMTLSCPRNQLLTRDQYGWRLRATRKKGCIYGMGLEAYVIPGSYYLSSPLPPSSSSSSLAKQIQEAVMTAIEPFHDHLPALESSFPPSPPSSSSPPPYTSDH
ncbi:uncharacterized protein LOC127787478 [Diospyros lotus]|uniref:uncharacterized protein LOC127787478 n=1 Tax=Diospyros lotus TaxID=55363 RepID=UPI00224E670B|nr:uncharacterized protein LOC127787478 [Diospyros lotus]